MAESVFDKLKKINQFSKQEEIPKTEKERKIGKKKKHACMVYFDEQTYKDLEEFKEKTGVSNSSLILMMIKDYISKHK